PSWACATSSTQPQCASSSGMVCLENSRHEKRQSCTIISDALNCHSCIVFSNHLLFPFTMSESIKHVSDASFEADVINSDVPVLVDYWATWCGPCKMVAPLLDEAAKQYEGRVIIAKVDVDANPETPAKFC